MTNILVSSEWVKDHLDDDHLIFFDIQYYQIILKKNV